jgi:hypothetical protein
LSSCVVSQAKDNSDSPDFFTIDLSLEDSDVVEGRGGTQDEEKTWSLYGSMEFQSQYTTKNQLDDFSYSRKKSELSQARTTLRLNFLTKIFEKIDIDIRGVGFYDAFYHRNQDDVSEEEFEHLADELEIRDAFIQFKLWNNLWFKFGRQVIALGESDFTQITDVINSRDEREFGLSDLEDIRLPINATRLSYVGQRWGVDAVLTHEFESHRYAGKRADFDRYIMLRSSLSIDKSVEPGVGFSRPGKLLRGFWSHANGDISIVLAKTFDQTPVLALSPRGTDYVDEIYPEVTTYGISANWVEGKWLFKGEVARKNNTFIQRGDVEQQLALGFSQGELFLEKDIVQTLAGLEYSPDQDIQLASEITTTKILNHETALLPQKKESILSSRVVFEFYRDTTSFEILWSRWLNANIDSVRLTYNYDYSDQVQLSLGYIDFLSDDPNGALYPYRNNDRIFGSLTYSF